MKTYWLKTAALWTQEECSASDKWPNTGTCHQKDATKSYRVESRYYNDIKISGYICDHPWHFLSDCHFYLFLLNSHVLSESIEKKTNVYLCVCYSRWLMSSMQWNNLICFPTLQISAVTRYHHRRNLSSFWISKPGISFIFRLNKWALMWFSDLLLTVPFASRPRRLHCDDGPLTETQRAIHLLSEQIVTFVAFKIFKNHRLVKGRWLWLRDPF